MLDEFHETESWVSRVRDVMKSLGATYRWGLSGTPPLDTTDAVLEVAELLWYATDATAPFMSEALKHRKSRKQDSKKWLADEENKQKIHEALPEIAPNLCPVCFLNFNRGERVVCFKSYCMPVVTSCVFFPLRALKSRGRMSSDDPRCGAAKQLPVGGGAQLSCRVE